MIEVELVEEMPKDAVLSDYAVSEFDRVADAKTKLEYLIKNSRTWVVSYFGEPMMMIGLYRLSMVGYGTRIWMISFEGFQFEYRRLMKYLRRGLRRLLCVCQHLSMAVCLDNRTNVRFAEHLGFTRTGKPFLENELRFQYFEMRSLYGRA